MHKKLFALAAAAAIFASCSGDDGPTVHMAGNEFNGKGVSVAKYWTNKGNPVTLGGGTHDSTAHKLFVTDGGDVYVSGHEEDANGMRRPRVWKNGRLLYDLELGPGMAEGDAVGIFVHEGDVYVAGHEADNGGRYPALWKNNVRVPLGRGTPEENYYGQLEGVFVNISGGVGQVYACGNEGRVEGYDAETGGRLTVERAALWVDGVPRALTFNLHSSNYTAGAVACDVTFLGGVVYVVGSERGGTAQPGSAYSIAYLWELDRWGTDLTSSEPMVYTGGPATVRSLCAVGDDVYAAVTEYDSSLPGAVPVARCFINAHAYYALTGRGMANGIAGHGGDVYVAGAEWDSGAGHYVPKYWVNKEPHAIGSGVLTAYVNCIAVK
jgi:hypothetical protein